MKSRGSFTTQAAAVAMLSTVADDSGIQNDSGSCPAQAASWSEPLVISSLTAVT